MDQPKVDNSHVVIRTIYGVWGTGEMLFVGVGWGVVGVISSFYRSVTGEEKAYGPTGT